MVIMNLLFSPFKNYLTFYLLLVVVVLDSYNVLKQDNVEFMQNMYVE